MVLDDVAWMDPASVAALKAPMQESRRVAWLLARRSGDADPFGLARLFGDRADSITLAGLDMVDVARLVGGVDDHRLTAWAIGELYRETGGNPLLVEARAAELARRGQS